MIFERLFGSSNERKVKAFRARAAKINALEPMIREFTQRCLDPLVGGDRVDFVTDLGAIMPMRVVGMLFGIPEDYQHRVQQDGEKFVRTKRGGRMTDNTDAKLADGEVFADFIDWRTSHPADDLTTELLNAEFVDEKGVTRKLHRDELLMFRGYDSDPARFRRAPHTAFDDPSAVDAPPRESIDIRCVAFFD